MALGVQMDRGTLMPDSEKLIPERSIVESLFTVKRLRGPGHKKRSTTKVLRVKNIDLLVVVLNTHTPVSYCFLKTTPTFLDPTILSFIVYMFLKNYSVVLHYNRN